MSDTPKHPDVATIVALTLWLGLGSAAVVLCGRAMAGAFDMQPGPAIPLLTTAVALLASLSAWLLFHRDQSRGDAGRRLLDGFIALAPVALIACSTSVHASAATLALVGGVLLSGVVCLVACEGRRWSAHERDESLCGADEGGGAASFAEPAEGTAFHWPLASPADNDTTNRQSAADFTAQPTAANTPPHEHFERRVLPGGGEEIEAALIARFQPGQRQTAVHLPIYPVLPQTPHVECEPLDDVAVSLNVTSAHGYGVRVEVRRSAGIDSKAAVPIGLLVTTADSELRAA